MNNTNTSDQPVALRNLANAFGCNQEDTALLVSAIAAGLAGARAGLRSSLGCSCPGFSMVCASADPALNRLLKHLIEPAEYLQKHLRNYCRSISPERLDIRTTAQRVGLRIDPSIGEEEVDPFHAIPIEHQRLQAVLHPTIMLNDPDAKVYERGLKECADRAPFVVTSGFTVSALASAFARDCAGGDHIFESAQGSIDNVHTRLLLHCDADRLRNEFRAGNPLLHHALITAPTHGERRTIALNDRRLATSKYIAGIKECMRARYCGSGVTYSIQDNVAEYLENAAAEIDIFVRALAPEIQLYLRDASSLPMHLLWSFTLFAMQADIDLHVGAVATAKSILAKSATLLESLARVGHDEAEVVMLGKLSEKPQPFRGLVRRYSCQKRALHAPVVGRLLQKGYVRELGDLFHVTEAGQEFLGQHHMSMRPS